MRRVYTRRDNSTHVCSLLTFFYPSYTLVLFYYYFITREFDQTIPVGFVRVPFYFVSFRLYFAVSRLLSAEGAPTQGRVGDVSLSARRLRACADVAVRDRRWLTSTVREFLLIAARTKEACHSRHRRPESKRRRCSRDSRLDGER